MGINKKYDFNSNKIKKNASGKNSNSSLLALATSSDGIYLATGGESKEINIYDTRIMQQVISLSGHKKSTTSLIFRDGTYELFSASKDKTLKMWSIKDRAYIDTLFGHHSSVLAIDYNKSNFLLTGGSDKACRIWRINDDSVKIFVSKCISTESCCYTTYEKWITGDQFGCVHLWSLIKKNAIFSIQLSKSFFQFGVGPIRKTCAEWVCSMTICKKID